MQCRKSELNGIAIIDKNIVTKLSKLYGFHTPFMSNELVDSRYYSCTTFPGMLLASMEEITRVLVEKIKKITFLYAF